MIEQRVFVPCLTLYM